MATTEETAANIGKQDWFKAMLDAQKELGEKRSQGGSIPRFGAGVTRGFHQGIADVSDLGGAVRRDPEAAAERREALTRISGAPAPNTFAGKFGERFGRTVPFLAAGSAHGLGTSGVKAVLSEIAADVVGSFAGQAAEGAGFGPGGQMVAELGTGVASAFAPGVLARRVAEAANNPAEVARLAKEFGHSEEDVMRAAHFMRRKFAIDPKNPERFIDEAADRVEESRKLFPDKNLRPTFRQEVGDVGGQNMAALEERVARQDETMSGRIGGRKLAIQIDLEEQFDKLLPAGNGQMVSSGFKAVEEQSAKRAADAWASVDFNEIPKINTFRLKQAAKESKRRAGGIPGNVPVEAKAILDLPDEITPQQLQALRSNALLTDRVAREGGEVSKFRAAHLKPVIDGLNRELEDLPAQGSKAYKAALKATRDHAQLFNPKSVSVSSLEKFEDVRRAIPKIRDAPNPKQEVAATFRILDQSPGASDAFRREVILQAFDDNLSEKTPRSVRKLMKSKEPFYRAVLGDDLYAQNLELLKKTEIARRGRAGTGAAVSSTGSGVSLTPVKVLFAGAEIIDQPVRSTLKGLGWMIDKISGAATTHPEKLAIVQEAMLDGDLGVTLIRVPKKGSEAKWASQFDILVARAKARRQFAGRATYRSGIHGGSAEQDEQPVEQPQ